MPPESPEPRRRQEGNVVHLETQLRARVQMMIAWEMRREAREIIQKLKAQGAKVSLMAASEITRPLTRTCEPTRRNCWRQRRRAARYSAWCATRPIPNEARPQQSQPSDSVSGWTVTPLSKCNSSDRQSACARRSQLREGALRRRSPKRVGGWSVTDIRQL